MTTRRVVTGRDADGKSVFVSDEAVEPITPALVPGFEFLTLWGNDATPSLPTDGTKPPYVTYFPPTGGFRFALFTIPPGTETMAADIDIMAALAEFDEKLPGMSAVMEPDHPGMHTTDTVDVGFVLSGEVYLELDDGAEVHLKAGDSVVQNGTRHAWHNRSDAPCTIVVALFGAQPR